MALTGHTFCIVYFFMIILRPISPCTAGLNALFDQSVYTSIVHALTFKVHLLRTDGQIDTQDHRLTVE